MTDFVTLSRSEVDLATRALAHLGRDEAIRRYAQLKREAVDAGTWVEPRREAETYGGADAGSPAVSVSTSAGDTSVQDLAFAASIAGSLAAT